MNALAIVTVDLVRTKTNTSLWHVVALPDETTTLCAWEIPADALHEDGVDAHVVSLRGKPVCTRCRRRLG